jgi:hypothetical protein
MGLEPVMPAAQAAEIRAVGLASPSVRDDMIQVSPCGGVVAAGMAARAVAGSHESVLRRGRPVAGDGRWPVEDAAAAPLDAVIRTSTAGDPAELGQGRGCQ